jgi:hypothetical protein
MKLLSNWFTPQPAMANNKSKNMLEKALNEAYGFDQIMRINNLVPLYIDDFCMPEFVSLLKKVNYRLEIAVFANKIFKAGRTYSAWKMNYLFALAKNDFEIDTILYHICQNGVAYAAGRQHGLQIFENMARKRRIALIDNVFATLKSA